MLQFVVINHVGKDIAVNVPKHLQGEKEQAFVQTVQAKFDSGCSNLDMASIYALANGAKIAKEVYDYGYGNLIISFIERLYDVPDGDTYISKREEIVNEFFGFYVKYLNENDFGYQWKKPSFKLFSEYLNTIGTIKVDNKGKCPTGNAQAKRAGNATVVRNFAKLVYMNTSKRAVKKITLEEG